MEKGVYLLNYVGCHHCNARASVGDKEVTKEEEENGDEVITFKREYACVCGCCGITPTPTDVCTECGHEVATHCYEFSIIEEYQVSV